MLATPRPVKKIDRKLGELIITWNDGSQGVFPHVWLRQNALENQIPATTSSPLINAVPGSEPCPRSIDLEYDETLVIAWSRSWSVTRYPLDWLKTQGKVVSNAKN